MFLLFDCKAARTQLRPKIISFIKPSNVARGSILFMSRRFFHVDTLLAGLKIGDRSALARSITLSKFLFQVNFNCFLFVVESQLLEHRKLSQELLSKLPIAKNTFRIGISGSPGVGKSTLIEKLGLHCISLGHRVAALVSLIRMIRFLKLSSTNAF